MVRKYGDYLPLAKGRKLSAEQLLERFLFTRAQQWDYVEKLSGGELRRLYLCTVLISNPNFLILDEPTNDLDILTLTVLEDFLQEYQGVLVVVSHDRYFIDKIVDHIFVFQGDGLVKDFPGTYSQYRAWMRTAAPAGEEAAGEARPRRNGCARTANRSCPTNSRRNGSRSKRNCPGWKRKSKRSRRLFLPGKSFPRSG